MSNDSKIDIMRSEDLIGMEGRIVDNQRHRHHALQVVWAVEGEAMVEWSQGQKMASILLIDSHEPHALELNQGLVCLIEAQSRMAQALRSRWLNDQTVASAPLSVISPIALHNMEPLLQQLVAESTDEDQQAKRELDPRVSCVLQWLDEMEAHRRWNEVSLQKALQKVHLSQSRFLHLFSQELGTPWRSYLIWRRALVAVTIASAGLPLTRAAHEAGYSDSAHLSRQFKDLFGYSPSRAIEFSKFIQV